MTQEEKQLLLQDLCMRLPYGVICGLSVKGADVSITEKLDVGGLEHFMFGTMDAKPYLRSISSMTKEERLIYEQRLHDVGRSIDVIDADDVVPHIDWLLSRHLDFRGLIPMGLALEALPGMYKTA